MGRRLTGNAARNDRPTGGAESMVSATIGRRRWRLWRRRLGERVLVRAAAARAVAAARQRSHLARRPKAAKHDHLQRIKCASPSGIIGCDDYHQCLNAPFSAARLVWVSVKARADRVGLDGPSGIRWSDTRVLGSAGLRARGRLSMSVRLLASGPRGRCANCKLRTRTRRSHRQLSDCRAIAAGTAACVEHGTCKAAFGGGDGMIALKPALVFVAAFGGIS